jgi:ABC-2 type transport system permease protein
VLWYKAWLETRSRFLTLLCGMTAIRIFFVHHAESVLLPKAEIDTYQMLYFANHYLVGLWVLSVVLLGMGGLIRERAAGASSFTLALPVSRLRLVGVQIAMGVAESVALAAIPWGAILLTSHLNAREFPISQAAFYAVLLVAGGLSYFGLSVLVSSLIEGEFTAPAVAYGVTVLSGIVFGTVESFRPYLDVWRFMGGDNQLNKSTYLLTGPFPWASTIASLTVAAMLLGAAVVVIQRQEF